MYFVTAGVIGWLLMAATIVRATEPSVIHIRQVWASLPTLWVYCDINDEDGQFVQTTTASLFTATVGVHQSSVEEIRKFEDTSEGVSYVLLVDISKSVNPQFSRVQEILKRWVQTLKSEDRTAVVTFGEDVKVVQNFTSDKALLLRKVERLEATDNKTQLHRGLVKAMEITRARLDENLPRYRVIVTLSDGQEDFPGGMTQQEVIEHLKEDPVPIFALGVPSATRSIKGNEALQALGALARMSGGEYLATAPSTLEEDYTGLQKKIRQVLIARLVCSACVSDGQLHRVQLSYTAGSKIFTDGLSVRLFPRLQPVPLSLPMSEPPPKSPGWPYALTSLLIVFGIVTILLHFRKPSQEQRENEELGREQRPTEPIVDSVPSRVVAGGGVRICLMFVGKTQIPKGFSTDLVNQVVIGRSETECSIVIANDPDVSARHCTLTRERGNVFVRDLDSRSGTFVNGVPIVGRHKLQTDDVILLGRTKLRFSLGDETER